MTAPDCVSPSSAPRGQAEVEDLDPPALGLLDPQVGRLDVPVDQPLVLGRRQPAEHVPRDLEDGRGRDRPLAALEPVVKGPAVEEFHGQEGDAVVLADLIDGHDVVGLDGRGGAGFAEEAGGRVLDGGHLGPHDLEGDGPLESVVLGAEDVAHAPLAEQFGDAVAAESAEVAGPVGGSEEGEGGRRGGGALERSAAEADWTRVSAAATTSSACSGEGVTGSGMARLPGGDGPATGTSCQSRKRKATVRVS